MVTAGSSFYAPLGYFLISRYGYFECKTVNVTQFLKIRDISEDSLLHIRYAWNISFALLTDGILFCQATIENQELNRFRKQLVLDC